MQEWWIFMCFGLPNLGLALKAITFIGEEPSLSWLSDILSISTWSAGNGHAVLPNRSIILMRVMRF
jgi:hypothetical protein